MVFALFVTELFKRLRIKCIQNILYCRADNKKNILLLIPAWAIEESNTYIFLLIFFYLSTYIHILEKKTSRRIVN